MSVQPRIRPSSIEALEARIAPALLVFGANLLGGAGNPSTGESSVGDASLTLVKVLSGQALVWYDGADITGISFGPNTRLEINGSVTGDIVGNLTAQGRLSDSDNNPLNGEDGNVLLPNNLLGLKVLPLSGDSGSLAIFNALGEVVESYSIITGGSVSNVDVSFVLGGIYAGDGVFHAESRYNTAGTVTVDVAEGIDVNPVEPGVQAGFTFTTAAQAAANTQLTAGASIANVAVGRASGMQLISGSGAPPGTVAGSVGANGGSIANVTIDFADKPVTAGDEVFSYQIISGAGTTGAKGGAGGLINKVIELSSIGKVDITAGPGGIGTAGPGGAGGSVFNLDLQSSVTAYTVAAGDGGQGTPGGAGGDVHFVNFANRTTNSGLIFTGDFTGDGIVDVAVVDGGTGQIVIMEQAADGSFSEVVQFTEIPMMGPPVDILRVPSQGALPSDGVAVDVDEDGDLDLVIAFKGSSTVVVLFNQGDGSFYNTDDPMEPVLQVSSIGTFGAPNAIDLDPANPNRIVVAGSAQVEGRERGTLELLALEPGDMGGFGLSRIGRESLFTLALTDAALTREGTGFSGVIASQRNGELFTASIAQQPPDEIVPAFTTPVLFDQIAGGVRRIDISSDGTALAVLGPASFGIGIYDLTGFEPNVDTIAILPATGAGNPSVMRFVDDGIDDTPDTLFVLSNGTGASRITQFVTDGVTTNGFVINRAFDSSSVFRNFAGFGNAGAAGFAAVTSALNTFTFSPDFATTTTVTLEGFAGKSVSVIAGDGGAGVESGLRVGNGGAGGSIMAVNAEGATVSLLAGTGGNTQMGAGGHGGSIINPASFTPASGGGAVAPHILADDAITLEVGAGGSPALAAATASGGNGGFMRGLDVELIAGDLVISGGAGGNSRGGKAGAGGGFTDITILSRDGNLMATAGAGGTALTNTGTGGAGGAVTNFRYTLLLEAETEANRSAYDVTIVGGAGGSAIGAAGGTGGGLTNVMLDLDNSDLDLDELNLLGEDTVTNPVTIALTAGAGGNGTSGGKGGAISGLDYTSHHDQVSEEGGIFIGYFTMSITAGAGGNGTAGAGGAGGSFLGTKAIAGITGFDPDGPAPTMLPLTITAGDGGDGTTAGGAGGIIRNVTTSNAPSAGGGLIAGNHLEGANLTAGDGGNASAGKGGAGGGILNAKVGVNGIALFATAGEGGDGAGANGKGGVGGAISGGTFGLVSSAAPGLLNFAVVAGDGGGGATAGGAGGILSKFSVNIQQASGGVGGVSILAAGAGGDASASGGKGGKGGAVSSITQVQDLNSVITAIYAGDGGDAATGIGGLGGSAMNIKTTGFIGEPSDSSAGGTDRYGVFHPSGIPQGLFAGRGGDGTTDGKAGSVTNVSARQIAAIAALSATPNLFVAVERVSNVKADLIGYDVDQDNAFDGAAGAPQTGVPVDGFILAKAISKVTGSRAAFTFDV